MDENSGDRGAESLEDLTEKKERKWKGAAHGVPIQLSLDVKRPPILDENSWVSGSLNLKGALPVRKDLDPGNELTVTVADMDGNVVSTGIFEVGLPGFKYIKAKGAGIIGIERVHSANFREED